MSEQAWQVVAEPANEAAARILVGLLQSESIGARFRSNVPVPGLGISFKVEVPAEEATRAAAVLQRHQGNAEVTEEELASLALSMKESDSP